MARRSRSEITDVLRERVRRALETGAFGVAGRLPATRVLARELGANPRVVAAAYKRLAAEGLLTLRPRSGAYLVVGRSSPGDVAPDHAAWLAACIADAVCHGLPATALTDIVRRATLPRLRAAVIATTRDQTEGIVHELARDYGIAAHPVFADAVSETARTLLPEIESARLLVTTEIHATWVGRLAARLEKVAVVVAIRPDLLSAEWLSAMRGPIFVVAADARFLRLVRGFLAGAPGSANVRYVTAADGDAVERIPRDAAAYVTQAARRVLGPVGVPGRLIRPARIFSHDTVRAIGRALVDANLARRPKPQPAHRAAGPAGRHGPVPRR